MRPCVKATYGADVYEYIAIINNITTSQDLMKNMVILRGGIQNKIRVHAYKNSILTYLQRFDGHYDVC